MAITKIGYDIDSVKNITAPPINISENPRTLIDGLIDKTNEVTNNNTGFFMLVPIFITSFIRLSNDTQNGGLGYGYVRSATITSIICSILSLNMIEIEIINNFYVVAFFVILSMVGSAYIIINQYRE